MAKRISTIKGAIILFIVVVLISLVFVYFRLAEPEIEDDNTPLSGGTMERIS